MSGAPQVSILLPARDASRTLEACLASIRRQRFSDWECRIVDDGSTDSTARIAERHRRRDARFHLLSRSAEGLVPALNAGLAECRGALVARMDADDLMHRDRLLLQVAALEAHREWSAVGCHVRLFPRSSLGPGYREYEAWLNSIDSPAAIRRDAFVECPVAHPALTARRTAIEPLGYRDRGWPEDYDLLLRLLERGATIGVVPRRLLAWRHGPERLSQISPTYDRERFSACKAHFLARTFLASSGAYVLWGYGATGRALAAALSDAGRRPAQLVELHPGRLGNRIHGAPVVPPSELRRDLPLIVSVAGAGPRARIREWLARRCLRDGVDFVCAA